jgi:hypothetical protein
VTEGDWQDYVAAQVQRAAAILVIHSRTPGVRWELDHIRQRAMWFKRITVFPPQHPVPAEGLSLSDLGEGGLIRLGDRHPLCHVCPQAGRSFLVVGRQRDTEAYGRALLIALSLVIEGDGWAALTGARPADQA